jgi:hypothetical protein
MGRPIRPEWQFYVSPVLGRRGGGKHSLEFRRGTIFDGCPCRKSNPDILMVFMNEITAAYSVTAIHVVLDNLNTHEPNNLNTHEPKEELQREISPCGGSNPPAPAMHSGLGGVFSPERESVHIPAA